MKKKGLKFTLVLFLLFILLLPFAGQFLVLDESPLKSDVIIILSGGRGDRTVKGVDLFRKGFAPFIIMSGGQVYYKTTMADLMKAHALDLGVPSGCNN